jgi:tRNA (cmo5U34)-methyltransferase
MVMENETRQEIGMRKRITDYDRLRTRIPEVVREHVAGPRQWLDTGCGSGGSVRLCVSTFPDTSFVLADPSPESIETAKTVVGGSERCSFMVSTTDGLELEDGRFDVITAILSHHYYRLREEKLMALANCFRMLRSGGILVMVEHVIHDSDQDGYDREWVSYMRAQGLEEESIREMFNRRNTVYFPITREEHIRLLEEAGFDSAEVIWDTCSDIGFCATKRMC